MQKHLLINANYSLQKILFSEILYIEGLDDYVKIHLQNKKLFVSRMTMKNILEKLPAKEFIRVHRSYIIAINKINSVRNKTISLAEIEIPIGNSYAVNFFDQFKTN